MSSNSKRTISSVHELKDTFQQHMKYKQPENILRDAEAVIEAVTDMIARNEWDPEWGDDKAQVVSDIDGLRSRCLNARSALNGGKPDAIAHYFFALGQYITYLNFRGFEDYVRAGQKVLDRDNKGGRPKIKLPCAITLQKEVDEIAKSKGDTKAREDVGKKYNVSEATIRRHIEKGLS